MDWKRCQKVLEHFEIERRTVYRHQKLHGRRFVAQMDGNSMRRCGFWPTQKYFIFYINICEFGAVPAALPPLSSCLIPILITMANINKAKRYRTHLEFFHRVHICEWNPLGRARARNAHAKIHSNANIVRTSDDKEILFTFSICLENEKALSHLATASSCLLNVACFLEHTGY